MLCAKAASAELRWYSRDMQRCPERTGPGMNLPAHEYAGHAGRRENV